MLRVAAGLAPGRVSTRARTGRSCRRNGAASASSSRITRSSPTSTCGRTWRTPVRRTCGSSGSASPTWLGRSRPSCRVASGSASLLRVRSRGGPKVLLLDEPLSALDAHTKSEVRHELSELLPSSRLPTLLVTHDCEEAAALADEVGVLVDGTLRQLGTTGGARRVAAGDAFVASFTGANLLRGDARTTTASRRFGCPTARASARPTRRTGRSALSSIHGTYRSAREHADDSALNVLHGDVSSLAREVGNRVRVRVGPITAEVTAASAERLGLAVGARVYATFKATGTRLVPLWTGDSHRFTKASRIAHLVGHTPRLAGTMGTVPVTKASRGQRALVVMGNPVAGIGSHVAAYATNCRCFGSAPGLRRARPCARSRSSRPASC